MRRPRDARDAQGAARCGLLTHAECERVLFFETALPPVLARDAVRLVLSPREREEARARVPPPLPIEPLPAAVGSPVAVEPPAPFQIEVLPPRRSATAADPSSSACRTRILVIDNEVASFVIAPRTAAETAVDVLATNDLSEALDEIARLPPALLVCSSTKFVGRQWMYELLWAAHPELKPHFVFLVPPGQVFAPEGRGAARRRVIERPLTPEKLGHALAYFGARAIARPTRA